MIKRFFVIFIGIAACCFISVVNAGADGSRVISRSGTMLLAAAGDDTGTGQELNASVSSDSKLIRKKRFTKQANESKQDAGIDDAAIKAAQKQAAKEKAAMEKAAKKAAKEAAALEKEAKKQAAKEKAAQEKAEKKAANEAAALEKAAKKASALGNIPNETLDSSLQATNADTINPIVPGSKTYGVSTVTSDNKLIRKKKIKKQPIEVRENEVNENKYDAAVEPKKGGFLGLFSSKSKAAEPVVAEDDAAAPSQAQYVMPAPAADDTVDKLTKLGGRKKSDSIKKGKAYRYISDAKASYVHSDIKESEQIINEALKVDPENKDAVAIRNKIVVLKAKMLEVRKDFSEQCYYRGAFYFKSGDIFDALLYMEKALKLNPQSEKAKILRQNIMELNDAIVGNMGKADGKKYRSALHSFARENFAKAAKTLRYLQPYYPEVTNFLGIAETHTADKNNRKRSAAYVREAIKHMRYQRYSKAQEDLFIALEMDRENIDALVIFEQVKLELALLKSNEDVMTASPMTLPSEFNIELDPEREKNPIPISR